MKEVLNLKTVFFVSLILFSTFYVLFSPNAHAQPQSLFSTEICDPTLPINNEPGGGCDLYDFLIFIKRIIEFLLWIAIPIGVAFIAYGAFVIITAGGSEEKFKKGKGIITAAIIGVAIGLASWLIVTTVNKILTGYLGEL